MLGLSLNTVAAVRPVDLFKVKSGPPPGFEAAVLRQVQTNVLDVYFDGRKIGTAVAKFGNGWLEFANPKLLTNEVSQIADKTTISSFLAKRAKANTNHLCPYDIGKPYCKSVTPKIAGVILDPGQYRVYLFINPKYLKKTGPVGVSQLGLPTAKHSFIAKNSFIASGTRNDQNYALTNRSTWAYRNTRAQLDASIQENNDINTGTGYSQMTVQRISLGRVQNQMLYELGQLNTSGGSDFITQQYFAGAAVRNFNTGLSASDNYGSALPVFLTVPSTVRVYRNGILVATQQFGAGRHFIDTRNFPSGAYDVRLQITQNTTGQVQTVSRYFTKQNALPTKGSSYYALDVGLLQRNLSFNQDKFFNIPLYQNTLVFFYHNIYALDYNLGLESDFLLNAEKAYVSGRLDYYGTDYLLAPGLLLTSRNIYGLSFDTTYRYKILSTGLNVAKVWGRKTENLVSTSSDEVFNDSNQPLTTNDFRLNLFASASIGKGNLYGGVIYTQQRGSSVAKDYNLQYTQQLWTNEHGSWELSLAATRAQDDTTYTATLNYNFNTISGWNASASMGYNNSTGEQQTGHGNVQVDARVTKEIRWDVKRRLNLSGSVHRDETSKYGSASAEYVNNYLRGYLTAQHSFAANNNLTTYSGEIDSDFTHADGQWAIGYDETRQTGAIIDVLSPVSTKVKVMVDGSPRAVIPTNMPITVYMDPFRAHKVSIVPLGDEVFSYDKNAKSIVLYRGNFQLLTWTLAKQYILFTRLVDESGKPIKEALLKAKGEYNATDGQGYIQADVTTHTKTLTFEKIDGKTCRVTIPKGLKVKDNFVQVKSLICH